MRDKQDDGWFYAKRYGFGSGPPRTWQGWLVSLVFTVGAVAMALLLSERHLVLFIALIVPWTLAFLAICWAKTPGGWKWRWGKDEETW